MKKLLALSILLSVFLFSCDKDPEPEPEVIRAYCNLHHFLPEVESIIWEINGEELPDAQAYSFLFRGSVVLQEASEEIEFILKHSQSSEVLLSEQLLLEQDKFYNVIVTGSTEDPVLLFEELDTSHPQAGKVKFQTLHSIPGQGPVDIYMGDTILDNRVVSALEYNGLTTPFEAQDYDAIASITATAHSDEYHPDSVLLHSAYNDLIVSGASYLMVVSHNTYSTESRLTFWIYTMQMD